MFAPLTFLIKPLATAALLLAGVTAALAFEKPEDGVYKDRIDWGVTMDLSGPTSGSQKIWHNAFEVYMKALNEAGGVNGRKVNLLSEDSRFSAENERIAFEKFVSQTPALGMSGLGNSAAQVALLPLIKKSGFPILGTYSSAKAAIDPPLPTFYGAFCGFREMAQVGVGFFSDHFKLKAPKVAVVHLDVPSGKEYFGYTEAYLAKIGGTAKSIPIKVNAADATPQVLEISNMKPDLIAIHGVVTTSILLMKGLQQYGLDIPTVAITYLGTPGVYQAIGKEAGKNYHFVSCYSPSSSDATAAAGLVATATKYGLSAQVDDINFVSGWVTADMVASALKKVGAEPTREKLIAMLNAGFEFDSKGLASELKYTPENHAGLQVLKALTYDYGTNTFKSFGDYKDFAKYSK